MSVQVENLEKNMAKLTAEIPAEDFEKAVQASYIRNKNRFTIPGFRRGKAPRKVIERMYGQGIFYEEAINEVLPSAYEAAAKESGLDIVSDPAFSIESIEDGKTVVFSAEVAVRPEVKLGDYKGIEITKHSVRVTKEEIENELEKERQKNVAQVTVDREVKEDDIAVIDYEGFLPGETVPFKGGKGENFPLTIGSGAFIPGFEEQLIGASAGEEKDLNVTFPEDYNAAELAGKPVVFHVKVKEVKSTNTPELDDEFAKDVSETADTLEDLRGELKEKLAKEKRDAADNAFKNAVMQTAIDNMTAVIPDAMIESQLDDIMQQYSMSMQQSGFSLEQYAQMMGTTVQGVRESQRASALSQIQNTLLLEKVAEVEGIEISEEQIEKAYSDMAAQYEMEIDKVKEYVPTEEIVRDQKFQKAMEIITDSAVVKEPKAPAEEAAE